MDKYEISSDLMDAICDALTRLPYREVQGVIIQLSQEIEQQENKEPPVPQLITRH